MTTAAEACSPRDGSAPGARCPLPLPNLGPAVVIFGAPGLAAPLASLHYNAIPASEWKGWDKHDALAAIISDDTENPLALCAAIPGHVPKILLARDLSFAVRRAAARNGVAALVRRPASLMEITGWLDHFETRGVARRPSLLLIGDRAGLAASYESALLQAGLDVTAICDPAAALQALDRAMPDLIIADLGTPGGDGGPHDPDGATGDIELAGMIRQSQAGLFTEIVSIYDSPAPRSSCITVLVRPPDAKTLAAEIKPRAALAQERRERSERDPLSGLYNQTSFEARALAELARCRRTGESCSLVKIRIRDFKTINGTFGRDAGDHAIKSLSRLLRYRLRITDITGRLGGAEFGILFPQTSPDIARGVIIELGRAFQSIVFQLPSGRFPVTFSAGIAGSQGLSAQKLWRAADDDLAFRERAGR